MLIYQFLRMIRKNLKFKVLYITKCLKDKNNISSYNISLVWLSL